MLNSLYHIFRNDCPHCHKGKVFADKSFFFSMGFPKMNSHCSNCNFKFEKEPGYFFGAMFVSYGVAVLEGLLTYFCIRPFFDSNFDFWMFPIIAFVLLSLTFFNIRFSRMIWIYMFKNYSN